MRFHSENERRRRDSNPRDDCSPNGFQDRRQNDVSGDAKGTYGSAENQVQQGAELLAVIEAWLALPDTITAGIVAMTKTVDKFIAAVARGSGLPA